MVRVSLPTQPKQPTLGGPLSKERASASRRLNQKINELKRTKQWDAILRLAVGNLSSFTEVNWTATFLAFEELSETKSQEITTSPSFCELLRVFEEICESGGLDLARVATNFANVFRSLSSLSVKSDKVRSGEGARRRYFRISPHLQLASPFAVVAATKYRMSNDVTNTSSFATIFNAINTSFVAARFARRSSSRTLIATPPPSPRLAQPPPWWTFHFL